jgi:hypothetical protein
MSKRDIGKAAASRFFIVVSLRDATIVGRRARNWFEAAQRAGWTCVRITGWH